LLSIYLREKTIMDSNNDNSNMNVISDRVLEIYDNIQQTISPIFAPSSILPSVVRQPNVSTIDDAPIDMNEAFCLSNISGRRAILFLLFLSYVSFEQSLTFDRMFITR